MAKYREELKPKVFRIIFGVIAGYFAAAFAIFFAVIAQECFKHFKVYQNFTILIIGILAVPIAALSMFYFYGWMHKTLIVFADHENAMTRFFGKIGGGIGYVLQPIVLIFYGANKKWLYFFIVGLPCLLGGAAFMLNYFDIITFDAHFPLFTFEVSLHESSLFFAIALLLNGLLALCTKRCPDCGAMLTEIEHSIDKIDHTKYARYDGVDFYGDKAVIGKYYVCTNCGYVKKGIGFEVQTDGYID